MVGAFPEFISFCFHAFFCILHPGDRSSATSIEGQEFPGASSFPSHMSAFSSKAPLLLFLLCGAGRM